MNIKSITVYNLKIPFTRTVAHRLYTRNVTESIVVVIQDENDNQGMGEGTPRQYVTGETLEKSLVAAMRLSKLILNRSFQTIDELHALLKDVGDSDIACAHPAAFCALETALLDLFSRFEKKAIYQLFDRQCTKNELVYSGVIPSIQKEQEFLQTVLLVKQLNLSSLKVKVVDMDSGLSQLKMLRKKLGREIQIRVDANAAFTADTAHRFLRKAKPFNLTAIEQPVPKNDLAGLKEVSEHSDIAVIADESMYTSKGPYYLIENNICHGLNIRLSSCGGFRKAYHLYKRAASKRMTIVLGAHVGETAILSFAGRNLAMICPDARYLEGSFSKYVIQEDLVDEDITFGPKGVVPVVQGLGLGIEIQQSAVEKWSDRFATLSEGDNHN